MSAVRPPDSWRGRFVSTLDVLLFVRQQIASGVSPGLFAGTVDAHLMAAFIRGVHFHLYCCGEDDSEYVEFINWLRTTKKEVRAADGWVGPCLEYAHGDHHAAIVHLLDRCAEFQATRATAGQR